MSEQKYRKGRELTLSEVGAVLLSDYNARVLDHQGVVWRFDGRCFEYLRGCEWRSDFMLASFQPFFEALPAEDEPRIEVPDTVGFSIQHWDGVYRNVGRGTVEWVRKQMQDADESLCYSLFVQDPEAKPYAQKLAEPEDEWAEVRKELHATNRDPGISDDARVERWVDIFRAVVEVAEKRAKEGRWKTK